MKKYSTLLLSSTLLLASLVGGSPVSAQNVVGQTTTTTTTSQTTSPTEKATLSQPTTQAATATASAPANQPHQSLTTQQKGNILSVFYQRSSSQKGLKIEYAVWSQENGQDDLRWITASDYQTDITLTNPRNGLYSIHAYITINNKRVFLQESSVNINLPKPNITTSISGLGILDITVHNLFSEGQEVLLPTWSSLNGQDDIKWYTAQRQANGTYSLRVYLKHHHFDTGSYSIHLYTRDAQGRRTYVTNTAIQVRSQDVPSNTSPAMAVENLQTLQGKYQVTVQETATSKAVQSVQVATWSMDKQENIKWRSARLQNGKYLVDVDFQEHLNHTGQYQNHVYVTYTNGQRQGHATNIVDLKTARLPIKFTTKLAKVGHIQATLSNVYDDPTVRLAVWSDENGQDDLKWYSASKSADRTYLANVLLENHKGIGTYHVHAYNGQRALGAYTMTVTNSDRYHSNNTYPIGQCTWGAKEAAPWVGNYWGNANQWPASARRAGFTTGSTPRVGAVAVWTGGYYGHVGVVTAVESNTRIRIRESNYAGKLYVGDFRGWFNPVADGVTTYIYPH